MYTKLKGQQENHFYCCNYLITEDVFFGDIIFFINKKGPAIEAPVNRLITW